MRRLPVVFGLVTLGLALLVGSGVSQDTKKGKIKGMLPQGFKALGLSKSQVEKIYGLQIEHRTKIADLTKQIADLKKAESKAVFQVLTTEQREKYLKAKGVDTGNNKSDKDKK